MTQTGQPFPQFSLESHSAGELSTESLLGTRYIFFIYPKDDTKG